MSSLIAKIAREPALITGLVTAAVGLVTLFGVDLTKEQVGAIVVFLGAVMALVRFITTPSAEVAVQVKPSGDVVAGPAAVEPNGADVLDGLASTDVSDIATVQIKPELLT